MLDIKIIAIDKIKKDYFKNAIEEYLKRLTPFARIEVQELPAMSFNDSNKAKVKKEESELLIKEIKKHRDAFVIVLTEGGKEYDSVKFSELLNSKSQKIVFVIGGSLGFSQELLSVTNTKISLSQLTFPHELARLVLFEQVYRSVMISKGKSYHY